MTLVGAPSISSSVVHMRRGGGGRRHVGGVFLFMRLVEDARLCQVCIDQVDGWMMIYSKIDARRYLALNQPTTDNN